MLLLALVSSGLAKASLTKGQGDQSFDSNVSAPLYKVSADGKAQLVFASKSVFEIGKFPPTPCTFKKL